MTLATRFSLFLTLGVMTLARANAAPAVQQITVPEGTVIELRMETALDSETSRQDDSFRTTVVKSVWIDGRNVIPEESTIEGRVTIVKPAARGSEAGVIGVEFRQLTIDGKVYPIRGTLTSLKADERKQIIDEESHVTGQSSTQRNVLFIGGGAGAGAVVGAMAGGGKGAGIGALAGGGIGVLGAILSRGAEAQVPVGAAVAMQLDGPVSLTGRLQSQRNGNNDRMLYTTATMVRGAQTALRTRKYYQGASTGTLDEGTRNAIAHYQIDNNISPTGNLDEATAVGLGLVRAGANVDNRDNRASNDLRIRQRSADVNRKATALLRSYEASLGVRANNIQSAQQLSQPDLELLLQMDGFTTAATWYEQSSKDLNQRAFNNIGRVLVQSGQRVEQAMDGASENSRFQDAWSSIQTDMRQIALDISSNR